MVTDHHLGAREGGGKLALPELVRLCGLCKGSGAYKQRYIEGLFLGPCDMCHGAQFVYRASAKPVPESVRQQIASANNLREAQWHEQPSTLPHRLFIVEAA